MAHIMLYYHIVWRTKRSQRTISQDHERQLYAYIFGFCDRKGCKLIRVGGMPDHIHMLVAIRPDIAVSDFMRILKSETSKWLNSQPALFPHFDGWGNGYAAFTYSESQKEVVRRYIINQKSHHSTYSFREEYEAMLREWGLDPKQDALLED